MFYSVYGLRLKTNLPIPGLITIPNPLEVDVEVRLGQMPLWHAEGLEGARPWYTSPVRDATGQPVLRVWAEGDYFKLFYSDGTRFLVDSSGRNIWATWPDTLTLEDTVIYLEGPVLGFVLRLRGVTCLHASAVAVDSQALTLVGPAGAGKSTTAATFASLGFPILSDDVVALSDGGASFLVNAGYPRVRLWPESFVNLYGSSDSLPPLTPTWDKRYLDLTENGYRFQNEPLPLGAIYFIAERASDASRPRIEAVGAREGMMLLVKNTYTNYMLDMTLRAQEFELLSRLVAHVPLRQINPHTDPTHLPQLCEAVLADFRSSAVFAHS